MFGSVPVRRYPRRPFLLGLIGVAATTALAACGGSSPATSTGAPTSAATTPTSVASPTIAAASAAPTTAASTAATSSSGAATSTLAASAAASNPTYSPTKLAGTTINTWILDFAPFKEYWGKLGAGFEKLTGAKVNFQPQAWPIEVKLVAAMAAGTVPDCVNLMGRVLAPLVPPKRDLLEPTDDSIFKTLNIGPDSYFAPGAIGCWKYAGKHWGIPLQDNVVSVCYYARPDWLKADQAEDLWPRTHGKDIFESFDQVYELAKKMQKESNGKVSVWGTNSSGWNRTDIFSAMKSLGVDWWDEGQKKFNMDSDAAVQAIDAIIETPAQKLHIETELNQSGEDAFDQGKVALARSTISTQSFALDNHIPLTDVAAPPLKGGKPAFVGEGGWGAAVPRQAKQKEAGLEFLKFLVTPNGALLWLPIFGGTVPAILSMRDDPLYQGAGAENTRTYLQYQPVTTYMGSGFGYEPELTNIWEAIASEVRQGKLNSKQASQAAQKKFIDHYTKFYQQD